MKEGLVLKSPLVYVILLNYNGANYTIDCVESLKKVDYDNFKVVVVDNQSTDNSVEKLKAELCDAELIESGGNLGFAGGNNVGIKYALQQGAEYVLLLNNDTTVEPTFLKELVLSALKHEDAGIVGSKIYYHSNDKVLWFAGGNLNWFKYVGEHIGQKEIDKGQYDEEKEITFMTGCTMLIKREVFERVGLLPEEYFMYLEDLDFCAAVQEKGYKIIYSPKSIVHHKVSILTGGEESAFSTRWGTRNRLIFMDKYKNKAGQLSFLISEVFIYSTRVVKYIRFLLKGEKTKAKALIEGLKEGREYIKNAE